MKNLQIRKIYATLHPNKFPDVVLNIICNLNPLISPLITNPEFAIHVGINCGPIDDDRLRELDLDEGLDGTGVGILEIISPGPALCAHDGVVVLLLLLTLLCLDIGVCCRDIGNDGGSLVPLPGDLLGVLNGEGVLLYRLDISENGDPIN